MSTYIQVKRYGAQSKLLQFRGFHSCVGEDCYGILTSTSPHKPFFSLFARGGQSYFQAEKEDLTFNKQVIAKGYHSHIRTGDIIASDDYSFYFISTKTQSECLAYADLDYLNLKSSDSGPIKQSSVSIQIASFEKEIALLPNVPVSIGSDPNCTIWLNIEGIEAKHCSFRSTPNGIQVRALQGSIHIKENPINDNCYINSNTSITLMPTEIKANLNYDIF